MRYRQCPDDPDDSDSSWSPSDLRDEGICPACGMEEMEDWTEMEPNPKHKCPSDLCFARSHLHRPLWLKPRCRCHGYPYSQQEQAERLKKVMIGELEPCKFCKLRQKEREDEDRESTKSTGERTLHQSRTEAPTPPAGPFLPNLERRSLGIYPRPCTLDNE